MQKYSEKLVTSKNDPFVISKFEWYRIVILLFQKKNLYQLVKSWFIRSIDQDRKTFLKHIYKIMIQENVIHASIIAC